MFWMTGYYVFYDADEQMKDCLGQYYERQLLKKQDFSPKSLDLELKSSTAELVALSNTYERRRESPFLWIRMVVICIFVIFCAIAVMTVNSFDKLNDFIQTAVWMGEIIDTDESN